MLLEILHRLIAAFSKFPNASAWLYSAALVVIYALISLPIGLKLGFLKIEVQTSWEIIIGVIAKCLLFPAITEEVFFRVLLLPHPTENALNSYFVVLGMYQLGSFYCLSSPECFNLLSRWTQNFF
jgi:predicted Abi (CAAX) family protease